MPSFLLLELILIPFLYMLQEFNPGLLRMTYIIWKSRNDLTTISK